MDTQLVPYSQRYSLTLNENGAESFVTYGLTPISDIAPRIIMLCDNISLRLVNRAFSEVFIIWYNEIRDVDLLTHDGALTSDKTITLFRLMGKKQLQTSESWSNNWNLINQNKDGLKLFFENTTNLTTLNIRNNGISIEGVRSLSDTLQYNSTLTKLDLWGNKLDTDKIIYLSEALKHNTTLKILDLSNNYTKAYAALCLAKALDKNSSLTELSLWMNLIGDSGLKDLADTLKHNSSLLVIDVGANNITYDGLSYLADALQQNTTLKSIHVRFNRDVDKIPGIRKKDPRIQL